MAQHVTGTSPGFSVSYPIRTFVRTVLLLSNSDKATQRDHGCLAPAPSARAISLWHKLRVHFVSACAAHSPRTPFGLASAPLSKC